MQVAREERHTYALPTGAPPLAAADPEPMLDPAVAARGIWHGRTHELHWSDYRPRRWRWPSTVPPNLAPLALVIGLVAWATHRALMPAIAPGPLDIPQSVRDRAALLFVFCWLPAIRYLLADPRKRRPIPFFCTYGCLYSLYYALTPMFGAANVLVLAHGVVHSDPAIDYERPVNLLLAGWLLLSLGYWIAPRLPALRRTRIAPLLERLSPRALTRWGFLLLAGGAASEIMIRREWWPAALGGIANLLALLLEATLVVLVALWRAGKLTRRTATLSFLGIVAAVVLTLGGSATGRLLFVIFAIFIGIWLERPVLRARYIVLGAAALAGCVAVRGAMTEWREEVWVLRGGHVSSAYRSQLMLAMLRKKYEEQGAIGAVADGWHVIAQRSANVDLLIDVMRRTPNEVPYWDGFTYESLAGAFVPRFIWPDKPTKTLGQDFGHRYRYVADADHFTSINLPVVVEFYINFGTAGVLIGMFVLGILLKLVEEVINRPGQGLLISAAATPLLARMLVMECDLSLIFGGLPLQIFTLWLMSMAMLMMAGLLARMGPARPPWFAPLKPRRPVELSPIAVDASPTM